MNIFEAIQKGDTNFTKTFINNGGNVNITDESGYTALFMSAIMKRFDIVKMLKQNKAKTDFFTEIAIGDIKTISKYLEEGININSVSEHGHQALMLAAHQGHVEIIKLLIDKGANINGKHKISGNTALIGAVFQGNKDIVKLLIEAKVDINLKNNDGKSALDMAKLQGNMEIINLLVVSGAK